MPNVTITVPDELKAEMDKLAEVSWSEICRKAITKYIEERKNPTPNFELGIRRFGLTLSSDSFETGYPSLSVTLRLHNRMASEIMVDRILCTARFTESGHVHTLGSTAYLQRKLVSPNSSGMMEVLFPILKEKLESLGEIFTSTFTCTVICVVYVEGFREPYVQDVEMKIPIDIWMDLVKKSSTSREGR
jgi:hypothetical protein